MEPSVLQWTGIGLASLIMGAALAGVLVVKRSLEPFTLLAGLVAAMVNGLAFLQLSQIYNRPDATLWAMAIAFGAAGGGYALVASLLDSLARDKASPLLSPPASGAETGIAVVLFACAEPATYDPTSTAVMLKELSDEGLLDVSFGTMPFMFFAQKTRYRAIGGASPSISELTALAESTHRVLDRRFTAVEWATCSGSTSLARRVAQLALTGHRRIVIAELAVGETLHMAQAKREVDALRPSENGLEIMYAGSVSGSDRIAQMVAGRVMMLAENVSVTGAVLVGHGQPEERSRDNPVFDEQEVSFLNRIRLMLVDRGIPEANVRLAWANWREPGITSAVRHLAALGCRRVVIAPATFPLDTIETRLDLEMAVRQARVNDAVAAITMPAWKEDLMLSEELRRLITASVDERD